MNYKLAVIGSRDFEDYELLKEEIRKLPKPSLIISGKARGADSLAEKYASENGIPTQIFPALWYPEGEGGRFDKGAGMKRNVDIVENSDAVLAFWDGSSTGTVNSINLALSKKKFLKVIYYKIPELEMDDKDIFGFSGKYRWLSNMWPQEIVTASGLKFPSVENAYQACKFIKTPELVKAIASLPPIESKIFARKHEINTPNFEAKKEAYMTYLLKIKFSNPVLKAKLAHTCGRIEETNSWNDVFWGCCPQGIGQNRLGEIIMDIREPLISDYVLKTLNEEMSEEKNNCKNV